MADTKIINATCDSQLLPCCSDACCKCSISVGYGVFSNKSYSGPIITTTPLDCYDKWVDGTSASPYPDLCYAEQANVILTAQTEITSIDGTEKRYFQQWRIFGCVGNSLTPYDPPSVNSWCWYWPALPLTTCTGSCGISVLAIYKDTTEALEVDCTCCSCLLNGTNVNSGCACEPVRTLPFSPCRDQSAPCV